MADSTWLGTTSTAYATAANWNLGYAPGTADHVRFVALYDNAVVGSDQSGTAVGDFIVENGYSSTIGSKTTNLKIDPNFFMFSGRGQAFFDLHTAAITAEVINTASGSAGEHGLYLIGSAIAELQTKGGDVGVAARHNTTATVVTSNINGGTVAFGEGATLTTVNVYSGQVKLRAGCTTLNVYGGSVLLEEQAAVTTLNMKGGGVVTYNSTGTIGTCNIDEGHLECTDVGLARTISTLKVNEGSISYDPARVTVSARSTPDNPIHDSVSKAY